MSANFMCRINRAINRVGSNLETAMAFNLPMDLVMATKPTTEIKVEEVEWKE